MSNFDDVKDKVLSTIGKAADATKDFAEKAAEKTKAAGKIAKLNIEISSEKDNLKKAYAEIGKLYYDTHKDTPEGFFVQMFEEVGISLKAIEEKEAEIAEIKANKDTADVEVEFEEVVSEAEKEAEPQETVDASETSEASVNDEATISEDKEKDTEE